MAIELISNIKQKNNGEFFLMDSNDINYSSDSIGTYPSTSLKTYLDGVSEDIGGLQDLVGDTKVSEQIDEAIAGITAITDAEIIAICST